MPEGKLTGVVVDGVVYRLVQSMWFYEDIWMVIYEVPNGLAEAEVSSDKFVIFYA